MISTKLDVIWRRSASMKCNRGRKHRAQRRLPSMTMASLTMMLALAITSSQAFAKTPGWKVQDIQFQGTTFTEAYVQSPNGRLVFVCNRTTKDLSIYFQSPNPLTAKAGDTIPGRIAMPAPDLKINWTVTVPDTGSVKLSEWLMVPLFLKMGLDADGKGDAVVQVGESTPVRLPLADFQYQGRIVAYLCGL